VARDCDIIHFYVFGGSEIIKEFEKDDVLKILKHFTKGVILMGRRSHPEEDKLTYFLADGKEYDSYVDCFAANKQEEI